MVAKTDYIKRLANTLYNGNRKMTFDQLAADLNTNGFKTNSGTIYSRGRGVARLVHAVYYRLENAGFDQDAEKVALCFTNKDGDYSY